jgi:hypothetical protein
MPTFGITPDTGHMMLCVFIMTPTCKCTADPCRSQGTFQHNQAIGAQDTPTCPRSTSDFLPWSDLHTIAHLQTYSAACTCPTPVLAACAQPAAEQQLLISLPLNHAETL